MVKQRIIEESSALFIKSGIKSTTMDDIAKHMGMSKRTIYEHFRDKEALLAACIDDFYKKNRAFAEKVLDESNNIIEAVVTLLKKGSEQAQQQQYIVINDVRKYYPMIYKDLLLCRQADGQKEMIGLVLRGMREGVFREDLNPEIIAHVFARQAEGIASREQELDKFSATEVFENMVISFMRGLCTLQGIEILDHLTSKDDFINK